MDEKLAPDSPPTRVLLVDDHAVLATAVAMALEVEDDLTVVGIAATLAQARALVARERPDVVLLDHRLPDGDGVGAIASIHDLHPDARVVMLTANDGDQVLLNALAEGAAGFVSKTRDLADVTAAVRAAAHDEAAISPAALARLLPRLVRRPRDNRRPAIQELTERELEVLSLLADGLTNAAIADKLVLSVHTVRNHVSNLSAKLGAHSKLEALSIAVREGLLPQR